MDVQQLISELAKLPDTADELRKLAEQIERDASERARRIRKLADGLAGQSANQGGRTHRQQIEEYLRKHGPSTRDEIKSALSEAVVKSALRAEFFDKNNDGKWRLKRP